MKFSSLNLVRKTWILFSGVGYMNWGFVLVGVSSRLDVKICQSLFSLVGCVKALLENRDRNNRISTDFCSFK